MWLYWLSCAEPAEPSLPASPSSTPAPEETAETGLHTAPETGLPTETVQSFVPSFVTEAHDSAIAVRTNLPLEVSSCLLLAEAPCEDLDLDGLVDLWEDEILARVRPSLQLDEAEPLVDDPEAVLAMVGRVFPVGDLIHVYIMIGYHYDYGRCGLSSHDGDSERVAVALQRMFGPEDGPGDVRILSAYTAAHEGTLTDEGATYEGASLSELSFPTDPSTGEPRWRVWSSDGKHATYGSVDACESASFVPCIEEDCAPDGVDPLLFEILPPIANAGEPTAPLLTDLSSLGFPDEDAWLEQDFCGGRGRGGPCSAPVRDKLTADPF